MKTIYIIIYLFLAFSVITPSTGYCQAGELDMSFGDAGLVLNYSGAYAAGGIALQSDSKIIASSLHYAYLEGESFMVVRMLTDGSVDSTFGDNGVRIIDITNNDWAHSTLVQADDKIIVSGDIYDYTTSNHYIGVARLTSEGDLDSTFDGDGIALSDLYSHQDIDATSAVLQSDGKIVLAAYKHDPITKEDIFLTRLNTDGSLDLAFGDSGSTVIDFENRDNFFPCLALQSDEKIVMAAITSVGYYVDDLISLARFNTDGSLDTSFGEEGKVLTDFTDSDDRIYNIEINSAGEIFLAGETFDDITFNSDLAIYKYNESGIPDSSFGENGKARSYFESADRGWDLVLLDDGKILACGSNGVVVNSDYALQRYTRNGILDSTFGLEGMITTDFLGYGDGAGYMLIQPDNRILLSGLGSYTYLSLARYLNDIVLNLQESSSANNYSLIYPNPVHTEATIIFNKHIEKGRLIITNILGEVVKEIDNISGNDIKIQNNDLPAGNYYFRIIENNGVAGFGNFVLQ